jgi:hypothetical protein
MPDLTKVSKSVVGDSLVPIGESKPWNDSSMSIQSAFSETFSEIKKIQAYNKRFSYTSNFPNEVVKVGASGHLNGHKYVYLFDHLFLSFLGNGSTPLTIYDGKKNEMLSTGSGNILAGNYVQGIKLKDGRVYILPSGGASSPTNTALLASWSPSNGVTIGTASANGTFAVGEVGCGILLPSGSVLVLPSTSGKTLKLYTPNSTTGTLTATSMSSTAGMGQCILLPDGRVAAIAYNRDTVGTATNVLYIINPTSNTIASYTCTTKKTGQTNNPLFRDLILHDENTILFTASENWSASDAQQSLITFDLTSNTFSLKSSLSFLSGFQTYGTLGTIVRRPDGVYYFIRSADVWKYDFDDNVGGGAIANYGNGADFYDPRLFMTPDGTAYLLNQTISSGSKVIYCSMERPLPQSWVSSPYCNNYS